MDDRDVRPAGCDDTLRVTIYRIVQESLTNVARHAGAGRASVRVAVVAANGATADALKPSGTLGQIAEIQVEDDGKGMAPDTPFGLGLTGIEERVQALGGALTLTVCVCGPGYRSNRIVPIRHPNTAALQHLLGLELLHQVGRTASVYTEYLHHPGPG